MANLDWGTFSLGALIMLIVRECFSFLFKEREHRLELKKRYFDKKIDTTLKTLNSHEFCLKVVKDDLNNMKASLDKNISQQLTDIYNETQLKQLNQFIDRGDHLNMTICFFYRDDVCKLLSEISNLWQVLQCNMMTINSSGQNNIELKKNIETALETTRILEEKIKKMFELTRKDFKSYK